MSALRHRDIACAIMIDTNGRFLLQQRDDVVGIYTRARSGYSGATAKLTKPFWNA